MAWIEDRTNMFVDGLKRALTSAGDDIEQFIREMRTMLAGLPWESLRMVSECEENQAFRQMGIRLMEARAKGYRVFEKELVSAANEYAIPPSYSLHAVKWAQVTLHFASFMEGVKSLVSGFVKEL
jgi:hypothetical protein